MRLDKPTQESGELVPTLLSEWIALVDRLIDAERYDHALAPMQLILRQFPRHLATYQRFLQVAWALQQWDEGQEWGYRLLRADPTNAAAWRAVAMGAEQQGNRAQARSIWQRAFENAPYEPEIRIGLNRTTMREPNPLDLNHACLATLYLRGMRWDQAGQEYAMLLRSNADRVDFQLGLLIAQWQSGRRQHAYRLALRLVHQERNLLFPWLVLNDFGDANDRALAHNPIHLMDPDGNYSRHRLGIEGKQKFVEIHVPIAEVELLSMMS